MGQTVRVSTFFIAILSLLLPFYRIVQAQSDAAVPAPGPVTIPAGQRLIMQLETPMHTRTTKKGTRVEFTTAGDVFVENQIVIPTRSLIRGTVTKAKRAGRLFGRAELQLRFDDIKLADGTIVPLKATILRVGFDPVDPENKGDPKIKAEPGAGLDVKTIASATAQGATIGILTGSLNSAAYGAAAGAAIAITQAALTRGPDLDLPRSTMFEARFDKPMSVPDASVQAAQKAPAAPSGGRVETAQSSPPPAEIDPEPRSAEPSPGMSGDPSDEEKVTAKRPVLKRRRPDSGDVASNEPRSVPDTADSAPVDVPADPPSRTSADPLPGASSEPPARAPEMPRTAGSTLPTISVKVRMVQVDAVVRDRGGRMMDNLRIEDFKIYEDSVLQQIQSFSRDELPIAVALVVDRSGSVAPYIAELRRVAVRALNQLKPGDQVCLFSFAADVYRVEDLTTDRNRIAYALDSIHAGGGTDITDALYEAVKYLSRAAPGHRHSIILISDNQQTVHAKASESETIKMALESETVVYSLKTSGSALQLGSQLPSVIFGSGPVNKVAQETGGEVISVGGVSSLDTALGAVISRLRMRYSLGYYPSGTAQGGAFHEIKVRLDDRYGKPGSDYSISAKRGYYATGDSANSPAARFQLTGNRE